MGISDAVEDLGDDIGDYVRKRRGELMGLTMQQHSKAMFVVALSVAIVNICGISPPLMIEGKISCIYRSPPCPLAGLPEDNLSISVGLFSANIAGEELAVCVDWPVSTDSVCDGIKASRAFVFLAIVSAFAACICSVIKMLDDDENLPFKSVVCLAASGVFGLIAYSIWQGSVQGTLNDLVYDRLITQPGHADVRYWHTLGYSYCCILWAWIFALGFLGTKVMLPGLAKVDKQFKFSPAVSGRNFS